MKQIRGSKYSIDKKGRVLNTKTNIYLKEHVNSNGYMRYRLSINGVVRNFYTHRLLAECYLGLSEGDDVDHIDSDKTNNNLSNLRVCSTVENCNWGKQNKYNLPHHICYTSMKNRKDRYRYIRDGKALITSVDLNKVLKFKQEYEED